MTNRCLQVFLCVNIFILLMLHVTDEKTLKKKQRKANVTELLHVYIKLLMHVHECTQHYSLLSQKEMNRILAKTPVGCFPHAVNHEMS